LVRCLGNRPHGRPHLQPAVDLGLASLRESTRSTRAIRGDAEPPLVGPKPARQRHVHLGPGADQIGARSASLSASSSARAGEGDIALHRRVGHRAIRSDWTERSPVVAASLHGATSSTDVHPAPLSSPTEALSDSGGSSTRVASSQSGSASRVSPLRGCGQSCPRPRSDDLGRREGS